MNHGIKLAEVKTRTVKEIWMKQNRFADAILVKEDDI